MEETKNQESMKLVGRIRPHRGHTLFKYETLTGRLIPMLKKNMAAETQATKRVVIAEKESIYVTALNIKNAVKKLAKYHGISVKLETLENV